MYRTTQHYQETHLIYQNKDSDEIGTPKDKQKAYRVNGNIIVLHGKTKSDIQLTTDEKNAFTSSVDEFRNEVEIN